MAKDMFKKYIWIVNTLYSTGGITYKELVKRWENSSLNDDGSSIPKRTFVEYKNTIAQTFDINICCDASDGYKYKIENTEDLLKDPVKSWLLSSFAVSNTIQESRKLKGRILFERIPSGNDYLMGIVAAMREEKRIRISYQSFYQEHPRTTLLEPYCVKVFKQRWYLLARNCELDAMRTYALDRVLHLEPTDEAFTLPDTFDAEAYFHDAYGILVEPEELDVEEVQIKVTDRNQKRKYIRMLPLHPSQKEAEKHTDYSIFTYRVYPSYDFLQEIRSHGAEVEVLSPAWVREEFRQLTEELCRIYEVAKSNINGTSSSSMP